MEYVTLPGPALAFASRSAERLDRRVRRDRVDHRIAADHRHERIAVERMEAEIAQRHLRRIAGRHHQRGGAVGRRAADQLLRDRAGALGVVLDRDGLAEPFRKLVPEQAADDVGAATGGSADEDADRPRRPLLRLCRKQWQGRERARCPQQRSSGDGHDALSPWDSYCSGMPAFATNSRTAGISALIRAAELLGRPGDDLEARLARLRERFRLLERSARLLDQRREDRLRHRRRRQQRVERVGDEARIARLDHRRHVRQREPALLAGDRQRTQLSALDHRLRRRQRHRAELDLLADHRLRGTDPRRGTGRAPCRCWRAASVARR